MVGGCEDVFCVWCLFEFFGLGKGIVLSREFVNIVVDLVLFGDFLEVFY